MDEYKQKIDLKEDESSQLKKERETIISVISENKENSSEINREIILLEKEKKDLKKKLEEFYFLPYFLKFIKTLAILLTTGIFSSSFLVTTILEFIKTGGILQNLSLTLIPSLVVSSLFGISYYQLKTSERKKEVKNIEPEEIEKRIEDITNMNRNKRKELLDILEMNEGLEAYLKFLNEKIKECDIVIKSLISEMNFLTEESKTKIWPPSKGKLCKS